MLWAPPPRLHSSPRPLVSLRHALPPKDIIYKKKVETDHDRQNNPLSTSLNIHLIMAIRTFRYISFSTKSMHAQNHLTVGLALFVL